MKRIRIVKFCNEPVLAHIYEHIYLSTFVKLCENQGLLSYVDYRWHGEVYDSGLIYLDILLLSKKAQRLSGVIRGLKVDFIEEAVTNALKEIWAERQKYDGANLELLFAALEELHGQPWKDAEKVVYDDKTSRRSSKVAWPSSQSTKTRTLYASFLLDNHFARENRQLLPLFDVLASTLNDNVTDELGHAMNAYTCRGESTCNRQVVKLKYELRVLDGVCSSDLVKERRICKQKIHELLNSQQLAERVVEFLKRRPEFKDISPNELKIYEVYGVFVGDEGWGLLATEENIDKLLGHMAFEISTGRINQVFNVM